MRTHRPSAECSHVPSPRTRRCSTGRPLHPAGRLGSKRLGRTGLVALLASFAPGKPSCSMHGLSLVHLSMPLVLLLLLLLLLLHPVLLLLLPQ